MACMKWAVNAQKKYRSALEKASGYHGQRLRLCHKTKEQVVRSGVYTFRDRHAHKGDFRRLWIQRTNAVIRAEGLTYNHFIQELGLAGMEIDRRMFAELTVNEPAGFKTLVEVAHKAPPEDTDAPKA